MEKKRELRKRIKAIREEIAEIESLISGYRTAILESRSAMETMLLQGNIAANEAALEDARRRLRKAIEERNNG
jgi:predicted  nucleic acid-binding Zn-ribbon protein